MMFDQLINEHSEGVAQLSDYLKITSGKRPPIKSLVRSCDNPITIYGASSPMGFTKSSLFESKILVTGRVGTHGIIQRVQGKSWPSDNTLVIQSDLYEASYNLLQRIDYSSLNRGSTQPLITQSDLNAYEVPAINEKYLHEFESRASVIMALYDYNRLECERLAELRDTLLPILMSGEIDVSNIEITE